MSNGEHVQIERMDRRKRGKPGEEIEILLSDGSALDCSLRIWQRMSYHEGDYLTLREVVALRTESAKIAIQAQSVSLLARSDHSVYRMRHKLVSRGREASIVDEVLADLTRSGVLNDRRFAESWVRERVRRHPEGHFALFAGLRKRGVGSSIAESAVSAVLAEDGLSYDDIARTLAQKLLQIRGSTAESVSGKLKRRGFSPAIVRRAVAEFSRTDSDVLAQNRNEVGF